MLNARFLICLIIGLILSQSTFAGERSSTITISPDGQLLAVINNDSRSLTLVALPGGDKIKEIFVGRDPQTVAFNAIGTIAYITNRQDDSVSVIDMETLQLVDTIPVPDEPIGAVVSPGGLVFVSCMGADTIAVIDPVSKSVIETIETERHPRGLALSPDASKLYVIHFSTGRFSVINTDNLTVEATISTGADTNLSNSITLNADVSKAYLPQTLSSVSNEALLFDTTVFPVVSVVDLESLLHDQASRIHLDITDVPVNMPFDTALTADQTLYVLNSGSNDVSVIDQENSTMLAHLEVGANPRGLVL